MTNSIKSILREMWWFRATIIMVASPLLLSILIALHQQLGLTPKACNCLFMLLLMAIYWCTETVHLAVTSLIPLALAPLLSIQSADLVSRNYFKDLNILYMGGLMVAVLIEKSQLHRRIALSILRKFGTNPRLLMLGFMVPTWFLSMWISNSATAAMMLTIVQAVIGQLKESGKQSNAGQVAQKEHTTDQEVEVADQDEREDDSKWNNTATALCLSVAYAASCGGIATLNGSAPNLIMADNAQKIGEESLGGYDLGVGFVSWILFGFPLSTIMLILTWLWLQLKFLGVRRWNSQTAEEATQIASIINNAYIALGPMSFSEIIAAVHFALLGALWVSRNPGGAGGWGSLFPKDYVSDGTAAMLVTISMFLWPAEMPDLYCWRRGQGRPQHRKPLITWDDIVKQCHWGLILLMGGGFALADCLQVSGLSDAIGKTLTFFQDLPVWGIVICLSAVTACTTEITSNTAIASIFLPIVAKSAIELRIHPLYLMLPVAASSSFAFMLPVATGPNALAYASGFVSAADMAKSGAVLNLLGVGVSTLATLTWGVAIFHYDDLHYNVTNEWRGNDTYGISHNVTSSIY